MLFNAADAQGTSTYTVTAPLRGGDRPSKHGADADHARRCRIGRKRTPGCIDLGESNCCPILWIGNGHSGIKAHYLEQMVPLGTSARFFRTDVSSVTKNLIASITYKREECWGWSLGCILQIIADSCTGVLVAGDAGTSQKASRGGAIFVSTERTIPVKHWSPAVRFS
jgi:hypothetical protein